MFDARLLQRRDELTDKVTASFFPSWRDVVTLPPRSDRTVTNLAFLVARPMREAFEQRVLSVASAFPSEFVFEVGGPFPPFSFVELDLGTVGTA
jgi:hypothetical protein